MANDVCTFYSVSKEQYDALMGRLAINPVEGADEDTFEGETPLGKIVVQVNFTQGSGQLQVVILEKPALLHMETIKSKIREAIDNALVPEVPPHDGPVARPVSESPNPPRTRQRPVPPVAQTTTESTATK